MTIAEAAKATGLGARRLQRWCRRLGYKPVGRDYHLTAKQVARIREAAKR